ncbi:hypothetical protein VRU48_17675 [Pedobacter sp. KR3-3]|uniref:Uncharacterized protein n=1 Tax=Pedobacter albus TaxID=3113905 RepID=A0ABU7IBW2_9SPHI|nr:hypothetical protein [Pedobacter sp. KR3-3]MEE1946958.1 hypothetical protein [Pedobacter sp. KR3-3]
MKKRPAKRISPKTGSGYSKADEEFFKLTAQIIVDHILASDKDDPNVSKSISQKRLRKKK